MKASTIEWHLKRDNYDKLSRFCAKHRVRQYYRPPTEYMPNYFYITYHFDNGGWILAELKAGNVRSYSTADYFKVILHHTGAA